MPSINNALWVFASLALLACDKGATCAELGDYVFTTSPDSLEVFAGESYVLEMTFYPVPARRMRFSDEISRHISVWAEWWHGWEHGEEYPESLPESEISIFEISAESPLQFDVQFHTERDGEKLVLDFLHSGKLRDVPIGESVPLEIALKPMTACVVDSGEDYALADLTIDTR